MCAGACTSVSSRFLWTPLTILEGLANGPSFYFLFWCVFVTSLWCWTWRCAWRVLRRTGTRIWRQSKDNKRYEVFRLAQNPFPLLGQMWPSSTGPLQACHQVFAPSGRDQDRERKLVLPRLFALPRWPLSLLWGISSELNTFLLNMCIDAPESTTNSRSSAGFEVGAGVALASRGE